MKEGWELKLLLVLLLGTSLIACDSTPSCVTQPYAQVQQQPVATSSSSLAPLATGAAVGAVVGHLATKSYSKSKVDNKYKAKKVSLKKKSSYKSKSSKRK